MKFRIILFTFAIVMSFSQSQVLSLGVKYETSGSSPFLSIDLLKNNMSIDIGFNYDKSDNEYIMHDSSWVINDVFSSSYSFQSTYKYTSRVLTPSVKLRLSFGRSEKTNRYLYLSIKKPIVDVSGEFTFGSDENIRDNTDRRIEQLKARLSGNTYAIGLGSSSLISDRIKLLFDLGYYYKSTTNTFEEFDNTDPNNGSYYYEKNNDKNENLGISIGLLYAL